MQFTGSNRPSNLWTFVGYIECGGLNIHLPGTSTAPGSSSSLFSSVASNSGCLSESISCICPDFEVYFDVSGPGISYNSTYLGEISPLPVELVDFTVNQSDRSAILKWETASETNSDYFVIQRSENMMDWLSMGQVDAAGNSSILTTYEWVDNQVYSNVFYYRLKQVDYDGTYEYSPVRSLSVNSSEPLSIFPNPANDFVTISTNNISNSRDLMLLNSQGDLLRGFALSSNSDNEYSSVVLDLTNLPSGIYFISDGINTKKLMKH